MEILDRPLDTKIRGNALIVCQHSHFKGCFITSSNTVISDEIIVLIPKHEGLFQN